MGVTALDVELALTLALRAIDDGAKRDLPIYQIRGAVKDLRDQAIIERAEFEERLMDVRRESFQREQQAMDEARAQGGRLIEALDAGAAAAADRLAELQTREQVTEQRIRRTADPLLDVPFDGTPAAVSLSVVIATLGYQRRPRLLTALESVGPQLGPRDEVVVVVDAPEPDEATADLVGQCAARWPNPVWRLGSSGPAAPLGFWGHQVRNGAMGLLRCSHFCGIDDDDAYLPSAIPAIRAGVGTAPGSAHIFRMRWGGGCSNPGEVVWGQRRLRYGNVGTPMLVAPNPTAARFGLYHGGDFEFAEQVAAEFGACWHEDEIVVIRP